MNPSCQILSSVILFTTLLLPCRLTNADSTDTINRLLPALARVESKNDPNAIGDGGAAIGIYQIHRAYWQDAVDFDKSLGGSYNDCFNPEYAKRVVRAYLKRYGSTTATVEQLARIHNGGPKGCTKRATIKYWKKVRKELRG
jgi:soluble lytic murein transglycosylase-like protein